jgi:hypothetical protein
MSGSQDFPERDSGGHEKHDDSPYYRGGSTQGSKINLPQPGVTEPLRRQVPESE